MVDENNVNKWKVYFDKDCDVIRVIILNSKLTIRDCVLLKKDIDRAIGQWSMGLYYSNDKEL